jgi:uncharacterized protein (TIGR02246 family)
MNSDKRTQASQDVELLYHALLKAWNDKNAEQFAALFLDNSKVVGFDGSQMDGPEAIEREVGKLFACHPTPAFVTKVKKVRFLYDETAIVDAITGMIPRGQTDIDPSLNSVHSMIATWHRGQWRIAHFQSTPAAFHGRPDLSSQLTAELRGQLSQHDISP